MPDSSSDTSSLRINRRVCTFTGTTPQTGISTCVSSRETERSTDADSVVTCERTILHLVSIVCRYYQLEGLPFAVGAGLLLRMHHRWTVYLREALHSAVHLQQVSPAPDRLTTNMTLTQVNDVCCAADICLQLVDHTCALIEVSRVIYTPMYFVNRVFCL